VFRSAWAGSHLNNVITWSGDIASDWATLRQQAAHLALCLKNLLNSDLKLGRVARCGRGST